MHPATHSMPTRQDGGAARCAGWFGIQPPEHNAFLSHSVAARRIETTQGIDYRYPSISERHVIPHDVNDVRRTTAVLLTKLSQTLIEVLILSVPPFSMLLAKYVVLRVVHDLGRLAHTITFHKVGRPNIAPAESTLRQRRRPDRKHIESSIASWDAARP